MNRLVCRKCKESYPLSTPRWNCKCGGLLDIEFEARFDKRLIARRKPTLWRYREAIPLQKDASIVSFDEGFTPLVPVELGKCSVFIKLDYLFPTGSYKDRGATVLMSKVKELGIKEIVEDSSGNAGSAIAAYSAKAGIKANIYVPESAAPGKMAQILTYGAKLVKTPGSRENTARAVTAAAQKTYYASHSWNPFFFHGTKTLAYEIAEQLGWKAPDAIVLPVGNGTLVIGAYIGFKELLQAGVIDRMPKIIAVQAENCSPLYQSFERNQPEVLRVATKSTVADGIAIAEPVRGKEILDAVRESKGAFIAVSEDDIIGAFREVGERGYYIEPTSAATIAGLKKYLEISPSKEVIVSTFTGSGLKETDVVLKLIGEGR